MNLQRIASLKSKTVTKEQMNFVAGGEGPVSQETGPGQDGITPPYKKFVSDCSDKNSKGQVYHTVYTAEDGSTWEWTADSWVPRD